MRHRRETGTPWRPLRTNCRWRSISPGKKGSWLRPSYSPLKLDLDLYQIGEVADKLTIEHADPAITIKRAEKTKNSEQPEQPQELTYTADGKTRQTTMADGGSIKSKTNWEGQQLVTKAKEQSTLGSMEVDETRSLSADGNTLTINLTFKGSSSHWKQKAVYAKEKKDTTTDRH